MISLAAVSTDHTDLRKAYGCFPSGVTAVCALSDGAPVGMAASSFTAVSISPPLVSVCVQLASTTWPRLRGLPRLGVSVLAEDQDAACRALAMKGGDRFADLAWEANDDGALFVNRATAWLECSVYSELSAGDHLIALLEIHGFGSDPGRSPLVFHSSRFRHLSAAV
ncbi:MAG: flavin reductase family protein [Acidimicrobiales bacterium]|nr:flavin reductase family protein [Acidimicrobiales bacterium]